MLIRLLYLPMLTFVWVLLPTAVVKPGENLSMVGFLGFGTLFSVCFLAAAWLSGLSRDPVSTPLSLICAWVQSGFLNFILCQESQGVHFSRYGGMTREGPPDFTVAFVLISLILVGQGEMLLWVQRARVAASERATLPSD